MATFFDRHLVNRRDVWGAYKRPEHRASNTQHTYTAPAVAKRGAVTLDDWRLERHVRGMSVGDVVGVHSTSADDTSRFLAFDLDAHGQPERAYLDRLTLAACWLATQLDNAGAVPLIEDSNGAGGYHVWIYFPDPMPTAQVYAWADALAERARLDFGVAVETYPKQSSARGAYGNWLRLPGRHHTRAHWSRVARVNGEWQSGADAVRTLLEWPATAVAVVPPLSAWPLRSTGITTGSTASAIPTDRAPIIRAYLRKLPHGNAGTERSNKLFALARFLRYGMRCTDAEALPILRAWNRGNAPPLDEAKVVTTWENSATYSNRTAYTLRTGGCRAA
ncbi:hypothetical protein [Gemmatimonas sp.]|uniref:TOTE conflict system archaeo-eukaryotic primase domain-containing protein n=1 Tax=Gemmatimonas sp. TaxID=1962908 RepID=UPI003341AC70